jgi:hypothetical protein
MDAIKLVVTSPGGEADEPVWYFGLELLPFSRNGVNQFGYSFEYEVLHGIQYLGSGI